MYSAMHDKLARSFNSANCNFAALQDLLKDLKYELGGHFEDIVLALMMPPADYDATSLRKAIKVSTEFIEFRQKGTGRLVW